MSIMMGKEVRSVQSMVDSNSLIGFMAVLPFMRAPRGKDAGSHNSKDVSTEAQTSRSLVLTSTTWASLESGHHNVGEKVNAEDQNGHEHKAEIGKVSNGHITQIIDTEGGHRIPMTVEAYKAKYHVKDSAQFSWPTRPEDKG